MVNVIDLIKCEYIKNDKYYIIPCNSAIGVLYINKKNPTFISGHLRMRGKDNGQYPYCYLEMLDDLFGPSQSIIEVCSNSIQGSKNLTTVDINPKYNPTFVRNGETLSRIKDNKFDRWRCDPPYNQTTAMKMYGTQLPNTYKLLDAGARVVKPGSLMFLLLGPVNYQICPKSIKRIGFIAITIVPNNELRCLHIYIKQK